MKAKVYKSTGSWYVVKTADGKIFQARIKGVMKIEDITSTNPIAVGDEVEIAMENELESTVIISAVTDRKNHVVRGSPHNKRQQHIVASNIDQSLLFVTLREPRTSQGFIDRFLIACEMYHVPAIIIFNKSDLYKKKELDLFEKMKQLYEKIGYTTVLASIAKNEGVKQIISLLKDKITLLSGHSGVGKSTFINTVFPDLTLKTQEVSGWSGKGMHTTTFAEMFDLPFGGQIIDTPGIREFGLMHVSKQELSHYFPEMRKLINGCQFNNCLHINEPGCAIKKAVADGVISEERYISYFNIIDTIDENNWG
jgi:ribosome biogenesis GTPase